MIEQEFVECLPFVIAKIMTFIGEMCVLHLILLPIITINMLQVWKIVNSGLLRPILSIGDDQLWFGRCHRSQFDIIGPATDKMYGQSTLTGAATKEVGGHCHDRGDQRKAIV